MTRRVSYQIVLEGASPQIILATTKKIAFIALNFYPPEVLLSSLWADTILILSVDFLL